METRHPAVTPLSNLSTRPEGHFYTDNVPNKNKKYFDRAEISIMKVRSALIDCRYLVLTSPPHINFPTGKTQLAVAFARSEYNSQRLYFDASSEEELKKQIHIWAKEEPFSLNLFNTWLVKQKELLLILDNANPNILGLINIKNYQGRLLIIAKNSQDWQDCPTLMVNPFTQKEAISFLKANNPYYNAQTDQSALEELAKMSEGNPKLLDGMITGAKQRVISYAQYLASGKTWQKRDKYLTGFSPFFDRKKITSSSKEPIKTVSAVNDDVSLMHTLAISDKHLESVSVLKNGNVLFTIKATSLALICSALMESEMKNSYYNDSDLRNGKVVFFTLDAVKLFLNLNSKHLSQELRESILEQIGKLNTENSVSASLQDTKGMRM